MEASNLKKLPLLTALVFAPSYPPAYLAGGPSKTLEALVATVPPEYDTLVVAPGTDLGNVRLDVITGEWVKNGNAQILYETQGNVLQLLKTRRKLRRQAASIVYLNSIFDFRMSILPLLEHRLGGQKGAELLLAPRGELDPGALHIRKLKKRIFLTIARLSRFYAGVIWHASSELEVENIKKQFGRNVRFVIREDETSLPTIALPPLEIVSPFKAIFVSRISPKKGLHIAIQAFCLVDNPAIFDIYGPADDDEYLEECLRLATAAPPWVQITFHGPLTSKDVIAQFHEHDAFVFPTAAENFGHVIAEALSASCLVLCTPTTPWTERIRHGGGVIIESRAPQEWAQEFDRLSGLTADDRRFLRIRSGLAFNEWQATNRQDHVFDMVTDYFRPELRRSKST